MQCACWDTCNPALCIRGLCEKAAETARVVYGHVVMYLCALVHTYCQKAAESATIFALAVAYVLGEHALPDPAGLGSAAIKAL